MKAYDIVGIVTDRGDATIVQHFKYIERKPLVFNHFTYNCTQGSTGRVREGIWHFTKIKELVYCEAKVFVGLTQIYFSLTKLEIELCPLYKGLPHNTCMISVFNRLASILCLQHHKFTMLIRLCKSFALSAIQTRSSAYIRWFTSKDGEALASKYDSQQLKIRVPNVVMVLVTLHLMLRNLQKFVLECYILTIINCKRKTLLRSKTLRRKRKRLTLILMLIVNCLMVMICNTSKL